MPRPLRPVFALLALCFVGAAATTQPVSPLLTRAHKILENLKTTTYQHKTEIDEKAGSFLCDCSGFIGYLLRHEMPKHLKAVPPLKGYSRPTAAAFHDVFIAAPTAPKSGDLWQQIPSIADARPGDLLAWRKPDPIEKGTSTGHIMLIDAAQKKVGENTWEIVVIDSTSRAHHNDTRKPDETGVGRGTVFLRTDNTGHPVSYSSRSPTGPFAKHPMSIARPVVEPTSR